MGEIRETAAVAVDSCYPDAIARAREAADRASDPVMAAVEMAITLAERNPEGARMALWRLQADWETLKELERGLGSEPTWAALRIGAVIQLARAELASPAPQLRRLLPEILAWLSDAKPERVSP